KRFNPFLGKKWEVSPYTACAYSCMHVLLQIAGKLGHQKVDFTFEAGPKTSELTGLIEKRLSKDGWPGMASYQFHDKKSRLVQTADALAYECTKRIRDFDIRKPRKSLLSFLPNPAGLDEGSSLLAPLTPQVLQQISTLLSAKKPKRPKSET